MKFDVMLAGVGGQGVLSMAALIGRAALDHGLDAKQSEVHGMAQRGGAVVAHLRLSDQPIASALIPRASADLIVSLEPLESLRYVEYLAPTGWIVSAHQAFVNIPDYPEHDTVIAQVRGWSQAVLVDAEALAERAGDRLAVNTVMVGAAARVLPVPYVALERAVRATFGAKGDAVVAVNLAALRAGYEAAA